MVGQRDKRPGVWVALLVGAIGLTLGIALAANTGERVIKITAERYAYEPDHILLRKGQAVVLELVSEDRMHGFNVPGLHIRADVMPGQPVRVNVVPERSGTYPILCDVFCGSGHGDMSAAITVSE